MPTRNTMHAGEFALNLGTTAKPHQIQTSNISITFQPADPHGTSKQMTMTLTCKFNADLWVPTGGADAPLSQDCALFNTQKNPSNQVASGNFSFSVSYDGQKQQINLQPVAAIIGTYGDKGERGISLIDKKEGSAAHH